MLIDKIDTEKSIVYLETAEEYKPYDDYEALDEDRLKYFIRICIKDKASQKAQVNYPFDLDPQSVMMTWLFKLAKYYGYDEVGINAFNKARKYVEEWFDFGLNLSPAPWRDGLDQILLLRYYRGSLSGAHKALSYISPGRLNSVYWYSAHKPFNEHELQDGRTLVIIQEQQKDFQTFMETRRFVRNKRIRRA